MSDFGDAVTLMIGRHYCATCDTVGVVVWNALTPTADLLCPLGHPIVRSSGDDAMTGGQSRTARRGGAGPT